MKSVVPAAAVVATVCAIAGVAIAGLPDDAGPGLVISPESVTTTSTPVTAVPVTLPEPVTGSSVAAPEPSVTVTLGRPAVRVVLAGSSETLQKAALWTVLLEDLGYLTVTISDALGVVDETTVYHREGFEEEAAVVAADLAITGADPRPLPVVPLTRDDAQADVVVLIAGEQP
jgi:hypothetical protein